MNVDHDPKAVDEQGVALMNTLDDLLEEQALMAVYALMEMIDFDPFKQEMHTQLHTQSMKNTDTVQGCDDGEIMHLMINDSKPQYLDTPSMKNADFVQVCNDAKVFKNDDFVDIFHVDVEQQDVKTLRVPFQRETTLSKYLQFINMDSPASTPQKHKMRASVDRGSILSKKSPRNRVVVSKEIQLLLREKKEKLFYFLWQKMVHLCILNSGKVYWASENVEVVGCLIRATYGLPGSLNLSKRRAVFFCIRKIYFMTSLIEIRILGVLVISSVTRKRFTFRSRRQCTLGPGRTPYSLRLANNLSLEVSDPTQAGLVSLADAIEDRENMLTYTPLHKNQINVYVSRVELCPLVVDDHGQSQSDLYVLVRRTIRIFPSGDLYVFLQANYTYLIVQAIYMFFLQNTLAEYMILSGADNRPPMLDNELVAKDLWERVQLLIQGTSLTKQERECKLYDAFDKFTHIKGESLHTYYLRFTQLINDMNIYKMNMEHFQVNTKFLNSLPHEWSKFVTDVKLVKDLHTSNYDQLHAYLKQYELHANEVRLMHERNQDPLAFVVNQQMTPPHYNTYPSSYNNPQLQQQFSPSQQGSIQPNQHYSSHYPSQTQFNQSSIPPSHTYQSHMNHQTSIVPQVIPQVAYQSPQAPTQLMTESPFVDSGFVFPVFSPGDDLIACLNKAMVFLTAVASSRRQGQNYSGTTYKGNATSSKGNTTSGQARVVKCYNRQGKGHMARQCTQPKRPRNAAWYKEKAMLAEAQEAGQILDEEQLAFLADPRIPAAVLMANISNYGYDVISEATVQDTGLQAQQDLLIPFFIDLS
nr:hypothetical protein [Tanacetum cinerariifolium]